MRHTSRPENALYSPDKAVEALGSARSIDFDHVVDAECVPHLLSEVDVGRWRPLRFRRQGQVRERRERAVERRCWRRDDPLGLEMST